MAYDKPYENKPYPDSGKLQATKVKKNEKSADYFGDIAIDLSNMTAVQVIDGLHLFKLSGWKKVSKAGNTYLSLSVSRYAPEGSAPPPPAPKKRQQEEDEF